MSYPINYPTPQGANVQIFTANTSRTADKFSSTWVKPQGASMVWFTLIGAGGPGGNAVSDSAGGLAASGGGGSGGVTNCMIPAFLIPDTLVVRVHPGIAIPRDTEILYQNKTGTAYSLLIAYGGSPGSDANSVGGVAVNAAGGTGGSAATSNSFSAAGIFQSVAGANGTDGNINQTTSTTTFLQGGVGGSASQAASQYGYSRASLATSNQPGYGIISPILVSVASTDSAFLTSTAVARNGFGCGGSGADTTLSNTRYGSFGGDGMAVIVTW